MSKTEKIARIAGKTTYRAPVHGFAGIFCDPDEDVKHALGVVKARAGDVAVAVLELRYAQAIRHENMLRRAWDRRCKERCKVRSHQATVAQRMGAALAIRHYAGANVPTILLDEYVWLTRSTRRELEAAVDACTEWMEEARVLGERTFIAVLKADQ